MVRLKVEIYKLRVQAMCERPELSCPQDKIDFLRRLIAYWTRQLNLHNSGKPAQFTPLEIDEIMDYLEKEIKHV